MLRPMRFAGRVGVAGMARADNFVIAAAIAGVQFFRMVRIARVGPGSAWSANTYLRPNYAYLSFPSEKRHSGKRPARE